jgi:N-acetylglucosamine kinase-like BadF-type ATPase
MSGLSLDELRCAKILAEVIMDRARLDAINGRPPRSWADMVIEVAPVVIAAEEMGDSMANRLIGEMA